MKLRYTAFALAAACVVTGQAWAGEAEAKKPEVIRKGGPGPQGAGMVRMGDPVSGLQTFEAAGRGEKLGAFEGHFHDMAVAMGLRACDDIVVENENIHEDDPGLTGPVTGVLRDGTPDPAKSPGSGTLENRSANPGKGAAI